MAEVFTNQTCDFNICKFFPLDYEVIFPMQNETQIIPIQEKDIIPFPTEKIVPDLIPIIPKKEAPEGVIIEPERPSFWTR